MTREELVLAKAGRIRHRLDRIRQALGEDQASFTGDEGRVEQVAFNIFLAMQDVIDIAAHIVADERWGTTETLSAGFDLLQLHGVLTVETAAAMRRGTKLRNLIAHGYVIVEPAKLFDAAVAGVGEIEAYLRELDAWLAAPRGPRG